MVGQPPTPQTPGAPQQPQVAQHMVGLSQQPDGSPQVMQQAPQGAIPIPPGTQVIRLPNNGIPMQGIQGTQGMQGIQGIPVQMANGIQGIPAGMAIQGPNGQIQTVGQPAQQIMALQGEIIRCLNNQQFQ